MSKEHTMVPSCHIEQNPYDVMSHLTEDLKLFTNINKFEEKSSHVVVITHVENPGNFYVRLVHQEHIYNGLSIQLKQDYELDFHAAKLPRAIMDIACVAYVAEYRPKNCLHVWARAIVRQLLDLDLVQVFLIDTGELLQLHYSNLRPICRKYTVINALASRCQLLDVLPRMNLNLASLSFFKQFQGQVLELYVDSLVSNPSYPYTSALVKLYRTDRQNKVDINQQIINSYGVKPRTVVPELKTTVDIKEFKQMKDEAFGLRNKGFARLRVELRECFSPSLIYLSLFEESKKFCKFFEYMHLYYMQFKIEGKANWQVNDRCCTMYQTNKIWRRAVILEINEHLAKVFYNDLGSVEYVAVSTLRELLPEFASVRDAVVKCHLKGLKPITRWTIQNINYIKDFFRAYGEIYIVKEEDFSNNSMPVEIWMYKIVHGAGLEPDSYEWHSLNKKIFDLGWAVLDKLNEATDFGDFKSEAIITSTRNDWLDLGPNPIKLENVAQTLDEACSLLFLEEQNAAYGSTNSDGNGQYYKETNKSEWLPPVPLPRGKFMGIPKHVNSKGVVFLHNLQNEGQLNNIFKILTGNFKHPDPLVYHFDWKVGDNCIALYSEDGLFYRARVLKVNEESVKCLVHYIDYGIEEYRLFSQLRKSTILHHIPTQVTECKLDGIVPVEKEWTSNKIKFIKSLIVGKKYSVKVAGEPIEGCVPITLIGYDNNYINDELVKLNLAVYTKEFLKHIKPYHIFYPKHENGVYECSVNTVNNREIIPFVIAKGDLKKYYQIFEEMQKNYEQMRILDVLYKYQPCIALYENSIWVRGMILKHDETLGLSDVMFIDCGETKLLRSLEIRETTEKWISIPPLTISAKFFGIKLSPEAYTVVVKEIYQEVLHNKGPFYVRIIKYEEEIPLVEVRNQNGEIINKILTGYDLFSADVTPD